MSRILFKKLLFSSLLLFSLNGLATLKYYEADMNESQWLFDGNPLQCSLSHSIPLYGVASFSKSAGQQKTLGFLLSYKRHNLSPDKIASVRAIAPSWQPLMASKELGEVKLQPGKFVMASQSMASWNLLYELESGRFPTINYQDLNQTEDQVSVALSAVRFRPAYAQFLDCMTALVQYDLEQISQLTLLFDFDKYSIKQQYRDELDALANYIKYDPTVEVVFIKGHTDSKGGRYYNQTLSENRIASVKNTLQLDGVDDMRFITQAFGETSPIASNRNESGRTKNRRVYISIQQN